MNITEYDSFLEFQKALDELDVIQAGQREADQYIQLALDDLRQITPPESGNPLYEITHFLQQRQY